MKTKSVLAFDFGLRYIGVAYGQTLSGTVKPILTIQVRKSIPWDKVQQVIEDWEPDTLVVGMPLNMDESEGELCPQVRLFAQELSDRYKRTVEFVDERLTSKESKSIMSDEGFNALKSIDTHSVSAALIAQSWLNAFNGKEMEKE